MENSKISMGTVRYCTQCRRGNVEIKGIYTYGDSGWYSLACGHTMTRKEADDVGTPKFVRWYPEGETI